MQVSASQNKAENGETVSVTVDFNIGETLKDLIDRFGENVVNSHCRRSIVVALQSFLRARLQEGKSADEIQAAVSSWSPGQRKQGKTPQEKVKEALSRMSPAERAALLKEYRSAQRAAPTE